MDRPSVLVLRAATSSAPGPRGVSEGRKPMKDGNQLLGTCEEWSVIAR